MKVIPCTFYQFRVLFWLALIFFLQVSVRPGIKKFSSSNFLDTKDHLILRPYISLWDPGLCIFSAQLEATKDQSMVSENLGGWVPGYSAEEQVWTLKVASSSWSALTVPFTLPCVEIRVFWAVWAMQLPPPQEMTEISGDHFHKWRESTELNKGIKFKPICLSLPWIFTKLMNGELETKKHAKWFALNHSQSAWSKRFEELKIWSLLLNQTLLIPGLLTGPSHSSVLESGWRGSSMSPCVSQG